MEFGDGIGKRLAHYRNIRGISAQKLADMTSGRISRGVITKIENGQKSTVSIDEVVLLASLLDVPPIALLLPIDRPNDQVQIGDEAMSVFEAIEWFTAHPIPRPEDSYSSTVRSLSGVQDALEEMRRYSKAIADLQGAAVLGVQGADATQDAPGIEALQAAARASRERLAGLGVAVDG